jgi:hypothetical protein
MLTLRTHGRDEDRRKLHARTVVTRSTMWSSYQIFERHSKNECVSKSVTVMEYAIMNRIARQPDFLTHSSNIISSDSSFSLGRCSVYMSDMRTWYVYHNATALPYLQRVDINFLALSSLLRFSWNSLCDMRGKPGPLTGREIIIKMKILFFSRIWGLNIYFDTVHTVGRVSPKNAKAYSIENACNVKNKLQKVDHDVRICILCSLPWGIENSW